MSNSLNSFEEPQPQPKKLNLNDLLPTKEPVETSLGTLYIRHAYTTDWRHFESDDAQDLGKAAVRQLSSRIEDKNDSRPLAEEDLELLNDADFYALVPVISKRSSWREMPMGAGLKELGEAIKAAKVQHLAIHKNMLADMRKSIDSSYRFLGKSTLEKLQDQMAGLVDIRSDVFGTTAIEKAMREINPGMTAIEKAMRETNSGGIMGRIEARPRQPIETRLQIPRPEDTRLGRATLESAEKSREVAQKMGALVDVVAGLNETLIKDVLPAWVKKVETDQQSAVEAFHQAANGLWWTKWAVFASVVVTVAATWLQVWVARDIDRGSTEQQKRVEDVLREQLSFQQKLSEQQARDAAAMREIIVALKPLAPVAAPKK